VDTLKIDGSFVHQLGEDPQDTAIVKSVIDLARTLRLSITAEGVETAGQLQQLEALGCDRGQGYYFARPISHEEVDRLLARGVQPARGAPSTPPAAPSPAAAAPPLLMPLPATA
jgi:EAL domain-containing protein (putative c-di-GMP-specific phosphodiesterase class I)